MVKLFLTYILNSNLDSSAETEKQIDVDSPYNVGFFLLF